MKKDLIDYDLDVQLALKDFPENEDDGYIYLRVNRRNQTLTHMSMASPQAFGQAIMGVMCEDESIADIVLSVVDQYLEYEEKEECARKDKK